MKIKILLYILTFVVSSFLMYISVQNKKKASGLKFSLTLDDIVLGKEPISLVSIMSSDVSHSEKAWRSRLCKELSR